jgi:hypothetical protein
VARDDDVLTVREATGVLRLQASRPAVRWLVAYAALFAALFSVTRSLEQPALEAVGVPVAGLGVLYAGFKLVSAGAAATTGWFRETLGIRRVFALLAPAYLVAYGALAVVPALVIPVLLFNRSRQTITAPLRNQYLNDRLAGVGRATVLSGAAMALSTASALAKFLVSAVAVGVGPIELLAPVGVGGALLAAVLWFATDPVRSPGRSGRDDAPAATAAD